MWQPMLPSLTLAQAGGEGAPGTSGVAAPPPAGGDGTQTPIAPGGQGGTGGQQQSPAGGGLIFMLLAVMVGMIVISMLGGRKEKKKKAQMMAGMGKGDRVQTIGGILGTVVEVRENDVLLKVDENANTKIRFAKSAVQTVLESKANKDGAKEAEKDADKDAQAEADETKLDD